MKNERKFNRRRIIFGHPITGNLRIILFSIFILFCVIIIIYHTYFESTASVETDNTSEIPKLANTTSIILFTNNNSSTQLHNPTISTNLKDHYLIAFEKVVNNSYSTIWLSESKDAITWLSPWLINNNLTDNQNPQLKYVQGQDFALYFISEGKRYIQISQNGSAFKWGAPEQWEFPLEDKSVYNSDYFFLVANQSGLWVSDVDIKVNWYQLMYENLTNSSIFKINDFEFLIVHENPQDNFQSITITTISFKDSGSQKTEIKWDLLILFIVIGIII